MSLDGGSNEEQPFVVDVVNDLGIREVIEVQRSTGICCHDDHVTKEQRNNVFGQRDLDSVSRRELRMSVFLFFL
jgi:hypothetical protein